MVDSGSYGRKEELWEKEVWEKVGVMGESRSYGRKKELWEIVGVMGESRSYGR